MQFKTKITIISLILLAIPLTGQSYSHITTHPGLSQEAVKVFNNLYPDNKISDSERDLIKKGSSDEDEPIRFFHHFYNPTTGKGLWNLASSKEWAFSESLQRKVSIGTSSLWALISGKGNDGKDFSYPRALKDYKAGDINRAFYSLGHVLHLVQDSAVPDHTRDDPHPPLETFKSPYESATSKWGPLNMKISENIKDIPSFSKPEDYLEEMAKYSHNYFFSADTILDGKENPKVYSLKNRNGALLAMGKDEDGKEFPLAIMNAKTVRNLVQVTSASLSDSRIGTEILDGYWDRLSKKAVYLSAGLIRDFMSKVNRAPESKKSNLSGVIGQALAKDINSDKGDKGDTNSDTGCRC